MSKLKVGDRVAVYGWDSGRDWNVGDRGTVVKVSDDYQDVRIYWDALNAPIPTAYVSPLQCKRLVRKVRCKCGACEFERINKL